MYLGVDIGGTKTLVAVLNEDGVIREKIKFPTPKSYDHFLLELRNSLTQLKVQEFKAAGVGMPVTVFDREHEVGISFGNLPWRNVAVAHDIEHIAHCPVALDNDAKLAGLSEALLLKDTYHSVLYVTVSTGIGIALVVDGVIDENIGDGGGRSMMLEHNGTYQPWESFASGHAIVERYNKRAMDITDEATWKAICQDLAIGFIELIALCEPQVIVIGGSVGTYFDRYGTLLKEAIASYDLPLVKIPKLVQAQRPEEAVVYGCYDLAKQKYGHTATSD